MIRPTAADKADGARLRLYNTIFPKGIVLVAGFPQLGGKGGISVAWLLTVEKKEELLEGKRGGSGFSRTPFLILGGFRRGIEAGLWKIYVLKFPVYEFDATTVTD